MAALFMVMVDMVVDPLSVLGDRWFLGKIFWYDPPGPHFGVPISNYLGWFFVAAITRRDFPMARCAGLIAARQASWARCRQLPSRALLGPGLYAGIVGFGIAMLFRIGAPEIAWARIFIFLPLLALGLHIVTRADCWGDAAAVERHLADFPYERSLAVWGMAASRSPARRRGVA